MSANNKVRLDGIVGFDPEVREIAKGRKVARFEERMLFIPKHIIVFPYASGWEQGTAILATSDDNCRELQHPHAFEITMKGYPKRRSWKTRPSEFPIYERTNTF